MAIDFSKIGKPVDIEVVLDKSVLEWTTREKLALATAYMDLKKEFDELKYRMDSLEK